MALRRQSTNSLKPSAMPLQFDQTCMSLLVMSCECSVCHAIVKPPIKMCLNGHLNCLACVLDKPSCPVCQERFSCVRLSVVEQILRVVGQTCPHARYGCLTFLDKSRVVDHERYCGWRRVQCLWCNSMPGVNKWAEHVVKKHGPHALSYVTEGFETIPLETTDVCKSLFYINGVIFCLFCTRGENNGPLYLTLQCFPTSKEDMDTVFEVSIENEGLYFCQSIHPISDAIRRKDVFKNVDRCVIIPCYLLNQRQCFSFKITVPNNFNKVTLKYPKFCEYRKNKMSI